MAEESNNIVGRVLSLENDVVNIGRTLGQISDKLDTNQTRTDARLQAFQDAQLAQVQSRSSNSWQLLISLGALAVALYGLTKEPISDKFMRDERDIFKLQDNTVPKDQVADIEKKADTNVRDILALSTALARTNANQENDAKRLEDQTKRIDAFAKDYALNSRVDLLSTRLQTVFDKNYAIPAIPQLQGGAAPK